MDSLARLFFEDATLLYIVLAVAFLVLAGLWYERRSPLVLRLLLVPPILAAAVFGLERFVVTDREQILQISRRVIDDVRDGKPADILQYLDDGFIVQLHGRTLSRQDVTEAVEFERKNHGVHDISLGNMKLEVAGERALMNASTTVDFRAEGFEGIVILQWELSWVKRQGGWKIRTVKEPR